MQIEIRPADEAWAEVQALHRSVWTPEKLAASAWRDIVSAEACQRVLIRDADGWLVSHIGIYMREAKWGERSVRIGGIGGVCTKDDCRRQGFARAGMACAASYMKDQLAADFGLLFCNKQNYRFYENCGWSRFSGTVCVEQPAGRIAFNISAPYILGLKMQPAGGVLDLHGFPW